MCAPIDEQVYFLGSHMDQIAKVWVEIETWDKIHPSAYGLRLSPGASTAELHNLAAMLGRKLPKDMSICLERHNGSAVSDYSFLGSNYLSCAQVEIEWKQRTNISRQLFDASTEFESVGAVRKVAWMEEWLPMFKRNKEPLCLDLSPPPGGKLGQVIEVDWEGRKVSVIAPSLLDFLVLVLKSRDTQARPV